MRRDVERRKKPLGFQAIIVIIHVGSAIDTHGVRHQQQQQLAREKILHILYGMVWYSVHSSPSKECVFVHSMNVEVAANAQSGNLLYFILCIHSPCLSLFFARLVFRNA